MAFEILTFILDKFQKVFGDLIDDGRFLYGDGVRLENSLAECSPPKIAFIVRSGDEYAAAIAHIHGRLRSSVRRHLEDGCSKEPSVATRSGRQVWSAWYHLGRVRKYRDSILERC